MEKINYVVVSCYNEEESIPLFYNEIKSNEHYENSSLKFFCRWWVKGQNSWSCKELAKRRMYKVCVIFQKFWERSSDVCGIKLCWRVCHNHGCGFTRSAKSVPEMMRYIKDEGMIRWQQDEWQEKESQRSGHFCKEILSFDQENFRYGNCRWSQLSIDDASVCKSSGAGRIQ